MLQLQNFLRFWRTFISNEHKTKFSCSFVLNGRKKFSAFNTEASRKVHNLEMSFMNWRKVFLLQSKIVTERQQRSENLSWCYCYCLFSLKKLVLVCSSHFYVIVFCFKDKTEKLYAFPVLKKTRTQFKDGHNTWRTKNRKHIF